MTLENGNMKVGLEILDKIENGTVISVYCETGTDDCQATMLFNTGICKLWQHTPGLVPSQTFPASSYSGK